MKKLFLLTAVIALAVSVASAQSTSKGKTRFGVAFEAGIPVGDAGDVYSVALGGSLRAEIPFAQSFFGTVSAGYTSWAPKKEWKDLGAEAAGFVPVKVGGKYFFAQNIYGAVELGAAIGTESGSSTAFAWAPGVGVSFPVSDKNDIDAGVRYESWNKNGSIDQVAFHVAFKF
ncbi:outer membrane beta-barrel protein [Pedobacter sp. BS3]|uniref:outer membrane beta-barrel protein n=1 Tax=Pedobacter sp. BS3 TaxID=2567937 RepID=UPI0011EEC129|nr:outer membrane beta-barrel protein [Pedobacter sp. BS3]TZF83712.1 outer membrane beta-barrel protein [Pedobacter sp. BS3]